MNNRVLFDLIEATQVGVNLEPSTLSVWVHRDTEM